MTMLDFYGISRVGEPVGARRWHLLLPSDLLDDNSSDVYLRIEKPKARRRGTGLIQHLKVSRRGVALFCEDVLGPLPPACNLYPRSPGVYPRRWDALLAALEVPMQTRLTPGCLRAGGAVAAYGAGLPISEVLWKMRIKRAATLESYLQDVAAASILPVLSVESRAKISALSETYHTVLGCPWSSFFFGCLDKGNCPRRSLDRGSGLGSTGPWQENVRDGW